MSSSYFSSKDPKMKSISLNNLESKRYDVYLSFCEQDAGYFVSRLIMDLSSEPGIVVFREEERFKHGDQVESALNVIEDCKIAIIVLSRNYTESISCLQALEKITKCCRTSDLIVLPVFYTAGSLDGGMFEGDVFHNFLDRISKEKDKFMSWVAEITKATKYFGPSDLVHKTKHRYEGLYIKNVVEHVTRVLKKRDSLNAFNTESINSRAQYVIQLLKQSKRPLVLGIWGMTGIGKSTIAQAVCDQIGFYFEHKCFLENVGGVWGINNCLVSSQDTLLCYICEQRLRHKRVLLVLDNVDKFEQLDALCRIRKWFGAGSKIIITTRDRHLLKEHGVDHIYRIKELDESESLELLNHSAFSRATSPREDYGDVSRQLVSFSAGLPLALKELGRLLHGKEVLEWKGVLRSLQGFSIPAPQLLEDLESSFSDLSDEEKQVFLDIACFFDRMNQNDVLQTLNRSTQSAAHQISLLENKSLITIDENNKLEMHVLLQAMARDIINRESSNKTNQPKMYDVFLSFRGEDCRTKFISHLYTSLQNAGIYTFRDDDEIQRGDQISISLLKAIGRSRISIVVLSTTYANSRWCMLELEKIMEIGRTRDLIVVPVFYEVDPSEVRHQTGQFGVCFEGLISTISVDESTKSNWRRDLIEIGGIAGFVLIDSRLFEFSLRILFAML